MRITAGSIALTFLCLLLPAAHPAAKKGDPEWMEGRSPHFHIISNAKSKKIDELTQRLEEFRVLLGAMFPGLRLDPPIPTTVVFFKNDKSFRPYKPLRPDGKPKDVAGYFQPSRERMFLNVNIGGSEPQEIAFHEYMHLLLELNMENTPVWLDEGLAMFYDHTEIDGVKVKLGVPHLERWQYLKERGLIPLRVLMDVGHDSEYYNVPEKQQQFYSQAWVLVHFLITAEKAARQQQFGQFVNLLHTGMPQEAAFLKAFGEDYDAMHRRLGRYLDSTSVVSYRGHLSNPPEKQPVELQPLDPVVAQATLAELWINQGRLDQAEKELQELSGASTAPPEALFRLGRIALQKNETGRAAEYFSTALEGRPDDISIRYYAALATWMSNSADPFGQSGQEDAARVIEYLTPILQAKVDFPSAYDLLVQAHMARHDGADVLVPVLQRTLELLPARQDLRLLLANFLLTDQRLEEAEGLLVAVLQSSAAPLQHQQAQDWLDRLREMRAYQERQREWRERPPQVAEGSHVTVPAQVAPSDTPTPAPTQPVSRPPASTQSEPPTVVYLKGTLVNVACSDDRAVLTVQEEVKKGTGRVVHLAVASLKNLIVIDPSESGKKVECGAAGVRVGVNYRAHPDGPNVAGTVMTVEFLRR